MKRKLFIFGMIASMLVLAFICIPVFAAEGETATEEVTISTQAANFVNKILPIIIYAGSGTFGSALGLIVVWLKVKKYKKTLDASTDEGKAKLLAAQAELEAAKKKFEEEKENFKDALVVYKEETQKLLTALEESEHSKQQMAVIVCECVGKVPQFVADGTAARLEKCFKDTINQAEKTIKAIVELKEDEVVEEVETKEEGV